MKKKILIVAAAALVTLGLATVSAQSPVRVQSSENFVFSVVEAPRYGAEGASVDESGNVTLDVKLHLIGDINGDGRIRVAEVSAAYAHATGRIPLEGYSLDCCDLNGDGRVRVAEVSQMYAHATGRVPLWSVQN